MSGDFQVSGQNKAAPFTLKLHRGEGMVLLAMNWRKDMPPRDFVGFAIEYKEPGGQQFFTVKNRLSFSGEDGRISADRQPTRLAPIQKFRWVHFPRNAEMPGEFVYRVTPVFMNDSDELSYGESQEVPIELRRETYPGKLNVTFTRGFVSSQAFVERYESAGAISRLLPQRANKGLTFKPTHPKTDEALAWMGFEARDAILEVLDQAIADKKAQVRVVAYDLNEPEIVSRLARLRRRLKVIIDDEGPHGKSDSAETDAESRLAKSATKKNVKRQHMGGLQHNKTIVVDGPKVKAVVCGSTNFSWRGFYVQSNNAVILRGAPVVKRFLAAFNDYWQNDTAGGFNETASAKWTKLQTGGIQAFAGFSPYKPENAMLTAIAADIGTKTESSLFYSLAFLYQTPGPVLDAIKKVTNDPRVFVYGISDHDVGGLDIQKPDGNIAPLKPAALKKNVPAPFKPEPIGGSGTRMHHKFVVIDFDKPSARVYLGSHNFSSAADVSNGENLLLFRDRRIAVAYMVEAVRMIDHYHFRVKQEEAKGDKKQLALAKPPRKPKEEPWWSEDYTDAHKIRDRELFA